MRMFLDFAEDFDTLSSTALPVTSNYTTHSVYFNTHFRVRSIALDLFSSYLSGRTPTFKIVERLQHSSSEKFLWCTARISSWTDIVSYIQGSYSLTDMRLKGDSETTPHETH